MKRIEETERHYDPVRYQSRPEQEEEKQKSKINEKTRRPFACP